MSYLCGIFFVFLHFSCVSSNEEKRLLLTDPDVILNRLTHLESQLRQQTDTISILNKTVQQQERTISRLETKGESAAMFTVWGRKLCPDNSTELVYSGFAAGSFYTHKGAAPEYLCLPPDPDYLKTTFNGGGYGLLYGAEYDDNFFVDKGDGNDVPCAVCRRHHASSILMMPGKSNCYSGWTREYYGYLASHSYSYEAAASFACMHIQPEFILGGADNHNGKLFQGVKGRCGSSLECPPYVNDQPLTCVVCSK